MITSKTKKQLIAFVILTLVGVTFVGARYARLDRLFYDSSYTVAAQYDQSGGIFTGAEVTYRGVGIGQVSEMKLTDDGVDVMLDIENKYDKIPKDSIALVGNKSAVGEQYVELQPQTDDGPYLDDGSKIEHRPDRDPGVDHGDPHQPEQLRAARCRRPTCARWSRSPGRRSTTPARASARSSTPRARSSRPPTPTSTSPPR